MVIVIINVVNPHCGWIAPLTYYAVERLSGMEQLLYIIIRMRDSHAPFTWQ